MKFGFMYVNRKEFHVDRMAKVLHVSQSGYYKWVKQLDAPHTEKELEDQALKDKIFGLFRQSRGAYGSRKITTLVNEDWKHPVNHKRVERIMRENDLFSKTKKDYECLVNLLPRLLEAGFEPVTLSEMFGYDPPETGGELYVYSKEDYRIPRQSRQV